MFWAIISLFYAIQAIAAGSDYRAGVANLDISPSEQVLIAGPAGELRIRTGAPSGLGVHALALEDRSGARFVIVSADLSGLSRSVADPVAAEALKRYGLDRASLLLSCSPAPAGPVLRGPALELFDLNPGDMEAAARYTRKVVEDLVSVIGAALADLRPAEIRFGTARVKTGLERDVRAIAVDSPGGGRRALLFSEGTALTLATAPAETATAGVARLEAVRGPLRAAFQVTDLPFAYYSRETFAARLDDPDPLVARHARAMLRAWDRGRPPRSQVYPVQAVSLGRSIAIAALGGDLAPEYARVIGREYGSRGLLIAANSNDAGYDVPFAREEGTGGVRNALAGLPGPFASGVERQILDTLRQVMKRVGR